MTAATARGGEVLELARKRVAPVLDMLATCEQQLSQACAEDDSKHAALLARDAESDLEIGAVNSEIWNVIGRPKQGRGPGRSRQARRGLVRLGHLI